MSSKGDILVVDDDPDLRELVTAFLEREGYRILSASDGASMRDQLATHDVDLVILDLVLPGEDGLQLAQELRRTSDIGIIILTGKGEMVDRVVGLEIGADDYVAKPFAQRELLARVRSVMRRLRVSHEPVEGPADTVRFNGWTLEFAAQRLTSKEGRDIGLTTAEFMLLAAFVRHPNRVLSRDEISELARTSKGEQVERSIDVLVLRLRRKIEADPKQPLLIKTVHGAGYIFTPVVERI